MLLARSVLIAEYDTDRPRRASTRRQTSTVRSPAGWSANTALMARSSWPCRGRGGGGAAIMARRSGFRPVTAARARPSLAAASGFVNPPTSSTILTKVEPARSPRGLGVRCSRAWRGGSVD
jgi:hypothetical protein